MSAETISAFVAAVSAIVSFYYAHKAHHSNLEAAKNASTANEHARRANAIAIGQAENELRRDITAVRIRFEDICSAAEEITQGRSPDQLSEVEKARLKPIILRQKSACEDYLNAYENASTKYLDNKIDTTRFEKSYASEIRNLFEPSTNAFSSYLHPEGVSRFKAIWKVYKKWNDLENR